MPYYIATVWLEGAPDAESGLYPMVTCRVRGAANSPDAFKEQFRVQVLANLKLCVAERPPVVTFGPIGLSTRQD